MLSYTYSAAVCAAATSLECSAKRLNDDGAGFGDELLRLGLGQAARIREPGVQLAEPIELGEIGRRRDEERDVRPAFARSSRARRASCCSPSSRASGSTRAACPSWPACGRRPSGSRRTAPASADPTTWPAGRCPWLLPRHTLPQPRPRPRLAPDRVNQNAPFEFPPVSSERTAETVRRG